MAGVLETVNDKETPAMAACYINNGTAKMTDTREKQLTRSQEAVIQATMMRERTFRSKNLIKEHRKAKLHDKAAIAYLTVTNMKSCKRQK